MTDPVDTRVRRTDADDGDVYFYEESEARRALSTTEFYVFIIVTVALLFFTYESGDDTLTREDGWRYATALTVGYLLSRGLAKAASSEPRTRRRSLD